MAPQAAATQQIIAKLAKRCWIFNHGNFGKRADWLVCPISSAQSTDIPGEGEVTGMQRDGCLFLMAAATGLLHYLGMRWLGYQ